MAEKSGEILSSEKQESKREPIDLSRLKFNFCSDAELDDFYAKDLKEMGTENVRQIRQELGERSGEMKSSVGEKLGFFLSNWAPEFGEINFTVTDKADFCIEKGTDITVDMNRLRFEKDFVEKSVEGITHEVFHMWAGECPESGAKENIIFRTVDEGLAVLVSETSLGQHYEKQGKSYSDSVKKSFNFFNKAVKAKGRQLQKAEHDGFRNMGPFYVVGYEVAKAILEKHGIEKFRGMLQKAKPDLSIFLSEYQKISAEDNTLPKIEL